MIKPKVLLICTLDTKEVEGRFLRAVLEEQGVDVIHLDPSIRNTADPTAEIPPEVVAAAAGKTLEQVRALKHEGKCQGVMIEGAIKAAHEANDRGVGLSAILGIGGSMGTALATAVMGSFPYGLPKVMISTMASGYTKPFVGTKDITMVNPVCDIAGLNSITRDVFHNAAVAAAAMAKAFVPTKHEPRPLVAMTTLGTTDRCSVRVREQLVARGFEVMVFHSTGGGGPAMDEIIGQRDVSAVVDLSLVEINDFLHNGVCNGGPDRSKAALIKAVPTIFVPGNTDFIVGGPLESAKQQFPGRRYHAHNPAVTAVRTEAPDLYLLAKHLGTLVRDNARGPTVFFVPLQGFSHHDSPEGYLHDPSLPPVLAAALRRELPPTVPVTEFDLHINDAAFADAVVEQVVAFTRS